MKKIYFLFFLPFLFALSCNKETGPTKINGTVRDATTNEAVPDAEVALFEKDAEIFGGFGGTQIDYLISDANGKFTFNFDAKENYTYYVQAIKDQYWNNQTDNITFVDDLGDENDLVVNLYPEGYLKARVRNINFYEPGDFISINGLINDPYYGDDVDTTEIITVYGNSITMLYVFIYVDEMNDGSIPYEVYCPSFDTTLFEILY